MGSKPISEPPQPTGKHLHPICFSFFISLIRLLSVSKRALTTNFTLARRSAISLSLSLSICHEHPYTELLLLLLFTKSHFLKSSRLLLFSDSLAYKMEPAGVGSVQHSRGEGC